MTRVTTRTACLSILVAPLALVGCGSSATIYDAAATRSCLESNGMTVNRDDADYIALSAVNGGYLVHVGRTLVNVSFDRNAKDGQETLDAYRVFGPTDSATLYSKGNAVFSWDDTSTDTEKATVEGCLATARAS